MAETLSSIVPSALPMPLVWSRIRKSIPESLKNGRTTTYICENGILIQEIEKDRKGDPLSIVKYSYTQQESYQKSLYLIKQNQEVLFRKWQYRIFKNEYKKVREFYYRLDGTKSIIKQVDYIDGIEGFVSHRYLYDESGKREYELKFSFYSGQNYNYSDKEIISSLKSVRVRDAHGKIIQEYDETKTLVNRKKRKASFTIPIMILDSGFDYKSRPYSQFIMGGISDNTLEQPAEKLLLPRFGFPKFSHGNLVAQVVAQNQSDLEFYLVADLTQELSKDLLKRATQMVQRNKILFANMSVTYDREMLAWDGGSIRPEEIKGLINATPQTLYDVPSGNGNALSGVGYDLDLNRESEAVVPVMLASDNILVIGSINSNTLKYADYPKYKLSSFSNYGIESVDVLAPGEGFCGKRIGRGDWMICKNGTSFATPFTLNKCIVAIYRTNPQLNIHEIKEIIMKTVYINLDKPFPVKSGGIIFPERAIKVAQYLKGHSTSIEDAVLVVRNREHGLIPGERNDSDFLKKLRNFWRDRNL